MMVDQRSFIKVFYHPVKKDTCMNLKILTVESDIQISQRTDTYLYLIQLIFFMKNMNYVSEYLLLSN